MYVINNKVSTIRVDEDRIDTQKNGQQNNKSSSEM